MKIVGLCKALTCGDFIPAVLVGIYEQMDEIVFVYPERDWSGSVKVNQVSKAVRDWKNANDYECKISSLHTELTDQTDQYNWAVEKICKDHQPDWIFIFDTDEVWEPSILTCVINAAEQATVENAIFCKMFTYIKSPLYRIEPMEPCTPCVMVRAIPGMMRGIRGNMTRPGMVLESVYFHHFSYVRAHDFEVFEKAKLSTYADGLQLVDMETWIDKVWNWLPFASNLHTTKGAENYWEGVREIDPRELPEAVRELTIYKARV